MQSNDILNSKIHGRCAETRSSLGLNKPLASVVASARPLPHMDAQAAQLPMGVQPQALLVRQVQQAHKADVHGHVAARSSGVRQAPNDLHQVRGAREGVGGVADDEGTLCQSCVCGAATTLLPRRGEWNGTARCPRPPGG